MNTNKSLFKILTIVLLSLSSQAYAENNKVSSVVTFKAIAVKNTFNNMDIKNQKSPLQLVSQSRTENKDYLLFENNKVVKKITLPTKITTDNYYWSNN